MLVKFFSFLILFLCYTESLLGQSATIDSLSDMIAKEKNPIKKIDLSNALAKAYNKSNDLRCKRHVDHVIEMARKISYDEGVGEAYLVKGILHYKDGELNEAVKVFSQAVDIFQLKNKPADKARALNNLAIIYEKKGELTQAMRYHNEVLSYRIQIRDTVGMATSHNNIGVIYVKMGDSQNGLSNYLKATILDSVTGSYNNYLQDCHNIGDLYCKLGKDDLATKYLVKALELSNTLKDSTILTRIYLTLGEVSIHQKKYNQAIDYLKISAAEAQKSGNITWESDALFTIANALDLSGQSQKALSIYDSCASIYTKSDDIAALAKVYINKGNILYEKQNDYNQSEKYFNKALQIGYALPSKEIRMECLLSLGNIYMSKKQYLRSIDSIEQAVKLSLSGNFDNFRKDVLVILADAYNYSGNPQKGFEVLKTAITLRDSLLTPERASQEILLKYEMEKRDKENLNKELEIIKQENKIKDRNLLIAIILLIALILGTRAYLLHKNDKISKEYIKIISEKNDQLEKLFKELHHRIANNLQSVSSLLFLQQSQVNDQSAQRALSSVRERVVAMGVIHRLLLKHDNQTKIDLGEYAQQIFEKSVQTNSSQNIKINTKTEKISFSIDADEALPLGLIINEVVTNACKYAFDGIKHPELSFSVSLLDNEIKLEIGDNGKGFSTEPNKQNPAGFGSKMIEMLCQRSKWHLRINSTENVGTTYKILINKPNYGY